MREYIRQHAPGGTFFFTLVTHQRRPILTVSDHVERLRAACTCVMRRHPFTICGAVVLPDHAHFLIELPPGDADFSTRVAQIKGRFARALSPADSGEGAPSASRRRRRERGVWQCRFWEHTIRDAADFAAHMDYIHYNPVKHGQATCPHAWPYSSFHRWVRAGRYPADWACSCRRSVTPPAGVQIAASTAGE